MALSFRTRRRKASELNIAPLIDVVFLLLVFFLLTSTFALRSLNLELPSDEEAKRKDVRFVKAAVVEISRNGVISLDGEVTTIRELPSQVTEALRGAEPQGVVVRAEDRVGVQLLVTVVDQIRAAGIDRIQLDSLQPDLGAS